MLKLRPSMSVLLALLVIAPATLALSGCGSSTNSSLDQDYMAKAEAEGKDKRAIFERAGGVYDSMTPNDKTKFLSYFKSEADARKFWDLMAHPPSSMGAPTGVPAPQSSGADK